MPVLGTLEDDGRLATSHEATSPAARLRGQATRMAMASFSSSCSFPLAGLRYSRTRWLASRVGTGVGWAQWPAPSGVGMGAPAGARAGTRA